MPSIRDIPDPSGIDLVALVESAALGCGTDVVLYHVDDPPIGVMLYVVVGDAARQSYDVLAQEVLTCREIAAARSR